MGEGATTLDSICRGELALEQPRAGYRFNVDAVILADFAARLPQTASVVDLGAGVGVVGLLLARRWPEARVCLIELQPELAALAARNVERNQLGGRVEVRCVDLRDSASWPLPPPALAVSNPPFYRLGRGHTSPRRQVSQAKHELTCTLEALLDVAAAGLAPGGRLALIHAAERELELLAGLRARGFAAERVRRVLPLPDRPPARVLVCAERGGAGQLALAPPLVVELSPGVYSPELRKILREP